MGHGKRVYKKKNIKFSTKSVMEISKEKFDSITQYEWKTRCKHVKRVEEEYLRHERIIDDVTERFIISLGESEGSVSVSDTEGSDADCSGSFEEQITDDNDCMAGITPLGVQSLETRISRMSAVAAGRTCRPALLTHPGPHFSSNSSPLHARTVSCLSNLSVLGWPKGCTPLQTYGYSEHTSTYRIVSPSHC
ncbi:hypothetical protein J6590_088459 [Homalodisca vitripennis]|nr:hypothetical protein J6590_088459 [Homalodisca vitripennis]